jgi:tungstate transport system permease protein
VNEVLDITIRSLWISGSAVLLASPWSILLAYYLSKSSTRLSQYIVSFLEALIGVPTVLIGLLLYMLLNSRGPLGFLHLLYTPYAIVIGEAILITPLIASISYRVLRVSWNTYGELALSLGASPTQTLQLVLRESWPGITASLVMGFSRAIGELGVALMVCGNLRGYTRVFTTAIALEVSKGNFETVLFLGGILVLIVTAISISLRILRRFTTI